MKLGKVCLWAARKNPEQMKRGVRLFTKYFANRLSLWKESIPTISPKIRCFDRVKIIISSIWLFARHRSIYTNCTTFLRRAECKNWYFQFRHCPYISITKLRATKKIFGNLYFSINLFSSQLDLSILQERIREDELKRRRKAWKVGIFVPSPLESSIEN